MHTQDYTPAGFGIAKAALTINEVASVTSICRSKLYEAISSGRLKATKFDKRTLILAPDLVAFLTALPRA
ncbi:helix-turn-helix domain-containing protein [Zavarzinia compransoris]|uniref:DNA-binding protein n=1 Tax=Zavarzinia compransoris TaxID=1264899 RepID=A0A317E543_9PROT|nr:helix-turn-helix domain-containing protein [Zavarzinia compransoris]PWR21692.1 DNA-binding protein [Zavarzinia compransoris]TDP45522.1 excisionase family DNA binding protein [Zavarzinia compransoris]